MPLGQNASKFKHLRRSAPVSQLGSVKNLPARHCGVVAKALQNQALAPLAELACQLQNEFGKRLASAARAFREPGRSHDPGVELSGHKVNANKTGWATCNPANRHRVVYPGIAACRCAQVLHPAPALPLWCLQGLVSDSPHRQRLGVRAGMFHSRPTAKMLFRSVICATHQEPSTRTIHPHR